MACGSSSQPVQPNSGPSLHALTVAVSGSGSVSSSPAGIDCDQAKSQLHATCQASFAQGTAVSLSAAAASGFSFAGWEGACSGQGTCVVTLDADAAVTARFTSPPPPGTFSVTVTTRGSGAVRSDPAELDCGQICAATFAAGTTVKLSAWPATGWKFAGWSGGCSGEECTVTGNASVAAQFEQLPPPPPPPPVDECAGLTPPTLPTPVDVTMPQGGCVAGTSDDGIGAYMLGYERGSGPVFPDYQFFQIQNGQAVRVGANDVMGSDEGGLYVFSQPSGFTSFSVSGHNGASTLATLSHDGGYVSSQTLVAGSYNAQPSSAIGVDPSGGTAVARHYRTDADGWITTYQRFDKAGVAETGEVTIERANNFLPVGGVGVALSRHALVIEALGASSWQARWLNRDGSALTDWFRFTGATFPSLKFLMDGSLALGFYNFPNGSNPSGVVYLARIRDGEPNLEPLPTWLQDRASNQLYVIRNGRGYATWGRSTECSDGRMEVLAASGKSCGCVSVPNLSPTMSVGRDGSLIVPYQGVGTCHYSLYPQVLK